MRKGAAVEKLLTPKEAAAVLGLSTGTLQNWRIAGKGPRFLKYTHRGMVRYPEGDLRAWVESNTRQSTSTVGAV